jgi:hypothetical protein
LPAGFRPLKLNSATEISLPPPPHNAIDIGQFVYEIINSFGAWLSSPLQEGVNEKIIVN